MRKEVKEFKSKIKSVQFDSDGLYRLTKPIQLISGTTLRYNSSSGTVTKHIVEDCQIIAIDKHHDVILDRSAIQPDRNNRTFRMENTQATSLPMPILENLNQQIG